MVQEALDRWWGPLMQMHGPRTDPAKDRDLYWRIKEKTGEQLRQEFLSTYVPRLWEIGLFPPDPELAPRRGDRRVALHASPTGSELRTVVTGHGPKSQERLDFRRDRTRTTTQWVRDTILAAPPGGRSRDGPAAGRPRRDDAESATASLEPWEVFRQEKDGDPMRHGGSVMAPDATLAAPLRPRDVQPAPGERPPVGRPPRPTSTTSPISTCSSRRSTARSRSRAAT